MPHSWADDPGLRFHSGTASYRRTVRVPAGSRMPGGRVFLDLGEAKPAERDSGGTMRGNSFAVPVAPPLREAATVFVNGRRAGSVCPPYRIDVTELLRDGDNEPGSTSTTRRSTGGGGRSAPDMAALAERYGQRTRLRT